MKHNGQFKKGVPAWNKGMVGFMKGIKKPIRSIEHRRKISLAHKGKRMSEEQKKKISETHKRIGVGKWMKGRKLSEKTIKKLKGRIPWNYQGISSKDKLERVKFRKLIQKKVFERDNYTCQICGIRGVNIQVDHIQPWSEYVELRFCIDNCRTLCAKCHYEVTFGKPMPPEIRAWGHNLFKGGNKL